MCNCVQANDISLNLQVLTRRWPFLGYRLPSGRRLRLEGDAGDFVGALLEGGEVTVTGNAGNYAGIGMKTGLLHIRHSTGKYTGEGMRGGTLRINGHIGSLGKVKHGIVYEGSRQVFPSRSAGGHTAKTPARD
jgi:formylmethanofuran dehydrogenase subunit C